MDKIIKKDLALSTKPRRYSPNKISAELYSHDKDTAFFEFTLAEEVATTNVVVLFYFKKSQAYYKTTGTLEGQTIKVKFDTTLITQDEEVTGYLYFEEPDGTNDVYHWTFDVHLSKIDGLADVPVKIREPKAGYILDVADVVIKADLEEIIKKVTVGLGKGYDDAPILERLKALESKPGYDDTGLRGRVDNLETTESGLSSEVDNLKLQDSHLSDRLATLENKPEPVPYDDSPLKARIGDLEDKTDNLTNYDDTALTQRVTNLEARPTYNDGPIQSRLQALEARPDKDTVYNDTEVKERLTALENRPVPQATANGKLGANLIADSGIDVTNSLYPTNTYYFIEQPKEGQQYTLTVKAKLGAGKTVVVAQLGGLPSFGGLTKVGDGLYSSVVTWPKNTTGQPYRLVIYIAPNNGTQSTIEWIKLTLGTDTDYTWYPNYNEIVDTYSFSTMSSSAIQSSANLISNSHIELNGNSEYLFYRDVAPIFDQYGTGVYTLAFDAKAKKEGQAQVYFAGNLKHSALPSVMTLTEDYKRYTILLDVKLANQSNTTTNLAFFGMKYGSGVVPSVKNVRLSKGTYSELAWEPTDQEKATLYRNLLQ